MADLTITETNISTDEITEVGEAGEQITAGMPVYLAAATGLLMKAINSSAAASAVKGISVNRAESGQPVNYIPAGNLNMGASLTTGLIYVVSSTAGKISPATDNGSGEFVSVLGVATSTSVLKVGLLNSGVAV